jgi:hypothetical protein
MEVIVATTVTSTKTGDYYQLPLIDFSMGLLRDYVQATVVYPYASIRTDAGGSARAFGNPEAGIKWRFVNNERLQVAFAPVYGFGVADRVADKGIGDRSDSLIIPVNAEFKINDAWRLNGEVSYTFVDQGEDEWGYGAAAAYSVNERWEFLLELSGTSVNGFDADIFDVRAGFDTALTDSLHFLFSIATRTRELSREDQLDYDVFLGLQFIN